MENLIELIEQVSKDYSIPQWLVVLAPIVISIMVVFIIILLIKILEPKHKQYKRDIFEGMIWKWKYNGDEIVDLWCYCPTCQNMLFVDDENCQATTNLGDMITFFICHECGGDEKGRIKGGDRRYSLSVIKRAILAKIRLKTFDIYAHMS